jgi:hypothetical protein
MASNQSSLQSDYDDLKAGVDRLQEKGGPAIAVRYTIYKSGTTDDPKRTVTATVYNVGNNKASRVTLKCRVIYDNQPSVNEQTFTNIAPMDKVSYTWEFSILADVESVWAEGS